MKIYILYDCYHFITFCVEPTLTILELKQLFSVRIHALPCSQHFIFRGIKLVNENKMLQDYGIKEEDIIFVRIFNECSNYDSFCEYHNLKKDIKELTNNIADL